MNPVKLLIECRYSDSTEREEFCLECRNLNGTILLSDLRIDYERMAKRLKLLSMNAPYPMGINRKGHGVGHCFRTINCMDIAIPMNHWTSQEIGVHMFMSLLSYLLLALIRMRMKPAMELYLPAVIDVLSSIRIVYMARRKNASTVLTTSDKRARTIMESMNPKQIL